MVRLVMKALPGMTMGRRWSGTGVRPQFSNWIVMIVVAKRLWIRASTL